MADTTKKKIVLKGKGHHDEVTLGAAAYPGEAVELQADGDHDPIASSQTESLKRGMPYILKEDALQGNTVNTQYGSGDKAFAYQPLPGDHVNVLVKSGEDIDVGDVLIEEAGGSGLFIEAAGTETKYRLAALEDSGGALGSNTLIAARVL